MQIVLLSMDPVFLVPLLPPRTFFFHSRVGRDWESERGKWGKQALPCQILFSIRKEQIAFPKKEKRRAGGEGGCATKHPSFALCSTAFESCTTQ